MQLTTKKPAQVTDNFFLVISFIKLFFFLNRSTIFTGRRFNIHARCKVFVVLQTICKSFISVVTKILHCTSNLLTWLKIVPSYILLINEFHGEVLRSNVRGLQMDPFLDAIKPSVSLFFLLQQSIHICAYHHSRHLFIFLACV